MSQLIYLKEVVTLNLDQKRCVGCGICLLVCPHAVLNLTNGKMEILNRDACMECGACMRNCPSRALTVSPGVGCAAAVINSALGRKKPSCCSIENPDKRTEKLSQSSSGCC